MALSAVNQAILATADPAAVEKAFAHLRIYLPHGRWLGLTNSYREDTISNIHNDEDATPKTTNHKHLGEYIAASVPLHVVDGWAYLGRALQAHLMGDHGSARHLGYYAELRATASLLASQGIGVFNKEHFVMTDRANLTRVNGFQSTHLFAWDALKWWADSPASADLLGDVIQPFQTPIKTWLTGAPGYAGWSPIARDWMRQLGVDLQRAADDQSSRNEASYRPSRMVHPQAVDARTDAEFAIALWLSLEPTPTGFANIDLHFMRRSFEAAFKSVEGKSPDEDPATVIKYQQAVDALMVGNSVDAQRRAVLEPFLLRQTQPEDLALISNAAIDSPTSDPAHHLHVLSRAALLLVIASSSARRLISRSSVSFADTQFWWGLLGTDRGLWVNTPPVADLQELWDDVKVELDDLRDWLVAGGGEVNSLMTTCPRSFSRLAQLELVALWGIAA